MSFLKDLRFPDPEGLVNRAAFNERFETLNQLYQHWWKRRHPGGHWEVTTGSTITNRTIAATPWPSDSVYFQYASEIDLSDTGVVTMKNPSTASYTYNTWQNAASVFRGKYIVFTSGGVTGVGIALNKIYYIPSTAGFTKEDLHENSYCYFYADCCEVTSEYYDTTSDWSYLQSPDRNAYPDSGESGGYEYQYLGIPFDNAREAPKIAKGEYTGTGTYGSANPNTLTFDFEPKLLLVTQRNSQAYPSGSGWTSMFIWKENMKSTMVYGNGLYFNRAGNSLSYYTDGSVADRQMNQSGVVYDYIALG